MVALLCALALPASAPASSLYDSLIQKVAMEERVDVNLLRAVVATESAFDANAMSPKGAMGLMQLMPGTARLMGVNRPFHPEDNLRGGARYLRTLIDRFDRVDYALAGYNAGPENIAKYNGIPPFQETIDYVDKVRERYTRQINGGDADPGRWRSATADKPMVSTADYARAVRRPPPVAKKIFVYRDAKGTLVLTDVQPKRRLASVDATVVISSGDNPRNPPPRVAASKATIRITPPIRTIGSQKGGQG